MAAHQEDNEAVIDLSKVPQMETLIGDEHIDNLDSDDDAVEVDPKIAHNSNGEVRSSVYTSPRSHPVPSLANNTTHNVRNTRRARGMSFLPVRKAQPALASSMPATSPGNTSQHSQSGVGSPRTPGKLNDSEQGSSPASGVTQSTPHSDGKPDTARLPEDGNGLIGAYISQLATKEARIVDLRSAIASLKQELKEAEIELSQFQENGKRLAEIVGSSSPSNSIEASDFKKSPNSGDVLGMGKRVVDGIGTQFWSFVEDVKSATMGNSEFEYERINQLREHNRHIPASRSSSPHRQLSPKRSIQNFIKNRSPSPIRNRLGPSRSPIRDEQLAEQHASQRLRESQRLSRKLSQLDLRAPSPTPSANS